jgi:hypothetical protein
VASGSEFLTDENSARKRVGRTHSITLLLSAKQNYSTQLAQLQVFSDWWDLFLALSENIIPAWAKTSFTEPAQKKNPVTFSGEKQKKLAYCSENSGKSARRRRTFWKIDVI